MKLLGLLLMAPLVWLVWDMFSGDWAYEHPFLTWLGLMAGSLSFAIGLAILMEGL